MSADPTQEPLFHEDIYDAFRHLVKVLGGNKKVGNDLWPDKPMEQAATHLSNCLDPSRAEKLDLTQVVHLLKRGPRRHLSRGHRVHRSGGALPR